MPSDERNSIMAKNMDLIFHCLVLLQPDRCLLAYCNMYNTRIIDLPLTSFCVPFLFADSPRLPYICNLSVGTRLITVLTVCNASCM